MSIFGHLRRWVGIAGIAVLVMAGFYFSGIYRAYRATTEPQQTTNLGQPFTPTPSPSLTGLPPGATPVWQTFRYPEVDRRSLSAESADKDRDLAFSIQYPPQWEAHAQANIDRRTLLLVRFSPATALAPQSAGPGVSDPVFTIQVTSRPYAVELEIAGNNVGGRDEDAVVAGDLGRRFTGSENPTATPVTVVVLPRGSVTFVLRGVLSVDGSDQTHTVDRMVSTLSFN